MVARITTTVTSVLMATVVAINAVIEVSRPPTGVVLGSMSPGFVINSSQVPTLLAETAIAHSVAYVNRIVFPATDTAVMKTSPSIDAPMGAQVVSDPHQSQMFQAVVVSHVVDVMDMVACGNRAMCLASDQTMLRYVLGATIHPGQNLYVPRLAVTSPSSGPVRVSVKLRASQWMAGFAGLGVVVGIPIRTLDAIDDDTAEPTGVGRSLIGHAESIPVMRQ